MAISIFNYFGFFMSRIVKENCLNISTYNFREWGFFKHSFCSGQIRWGDKDEGSWIAFKLDMNKEVLTLIYRTKNYYSEEWIDVNQEYSLTSTNCNYGGKRYWFICPAYRNGRYCGRRVAKLYIGAGCDYFACRHCYGLTYWSRRHSCAYTYHSVDRYAESVKKWYYRGEPTRKHRSYLRMVEAVNNDWNTFFGRLAKKIKS
jgi:hypothetical protein